MPQEKRPALPDRAYPLLIDVTTTLMGSPCCGVDRAADDGVHIIIREFQQGFCYALGLPPVFEELIDCSGDVLPELLTTLPLRLIREADHPSFSWHAAPPSWRRAHSPSRRRYSKSLRQQPGKSNFGEECCRDHFADESIRKNQGCGCE